MKTVSCNGSLIAVSHPQGKDGTVLFCSVPVGPGRTHGTVYVSFDGGRTWPHSKLVVPTAFAYSSLVMLPDGHIGLFYESVGYAKIELVRFSISWLLDLDESVVEQDAIRFEWSFLPDLPASIGYAGPFVGQHQGALIVAGGANFCNKPLIEGGEKVWHDKIYVLEADSDEWNTEFRLKQPLAYGGVGVHRNRSRCRRFWFGSVSGTALAAGSCGQPSASRYRWLAPFRSLSSVHSVLRFVNILHNAFQFDESST